MYINWKVCLQNALTQHEPAHDLENPSDVCKIRHFAWHLFFHSSNLSYKKWLVHRICQFFSEYLWYRSPIWLTASVTPTSKCLSKVHMDKFYPEWFYVKITYYYALQRYKWRIHADMRLLYYYSRMFLYHFTFWNGTAHMRTINICSYVII